MPLMDAIPGDVDELVEFWTLLDEDRALLSDKRGTTGFGFRSAVEALQPIWPVPAGAFERAGYCGEVRRPPARRG